MPTGSTRRSKAFARSENGAPLTLVQAAATCFVTGGGICGWSLNQRHDVSPPSSAPCVTQPGWNYFGGAGYCTNGAAGSCSGGT